MRSSSVFQNIEVVLHYWKCFGHLPFCKKFRSSSILKKLRMSCFWKNIEAIFRFWRRQNEVVFHVRVWGWEQKKFKKIWSTFSPFQAIISYIRFGFFKTKKPENSCFRTVHLLFFKNKINTKYLKIDILVCFCFKRTLYSIFFKSTLVVVRVAQSDCVPNRTDIPENMYAFHFLLYFVVNLYFEFCSF